MSIVLACVCLSTHMPQKYVSGWVHISSSGSKRQNILCSSSLPITRVVGDYNMPSVYMCVHLFVMFVLKPLCIILHIFFLYMSFGKFSYLKHISFD